MLIRCLPAVAFAAGCQGHPSAVPEAGELGVQRAGVEVRANGTLTARVSPGAPCNAMVEGVEVAVTGPPLAAKVGDVTWSSDDRADGMIIFRDEVPVARIRATPEALALFTPDGVTLIRVTVAGDVARVIGRDGAVARTAQRSATGIRVDDQVVTGTDDLLLAALLTASEAGPDVRALAACHRLLTIGKVL